MGCSPATPVSSPPECTYRRAPGILAESNFGACVRASHFCSGPPPPATQALSFCFRSSPVRGQCPLGETGIPGGPHACLWQRKSSVEGGLCVQVEGLETTATSHNNPLREGPGGPCGVPLSYPPPGTCRKELGAGNPGGALDSEHRAKHQPVPSPGGGPGALLGSPGKVGKGWTPDTQSCHRTPPPTVGSLARGDAPEGVRLHGGRGSTSRKRCEATSPRAPGDPCSDGTDPRTQTPGPGGASP